MDWIGHGGSDGLHGYVHSLDDAVDDLKSFLDKVSVGKSRASMFLLRALNWCSHCSQGGDGSERIQPSHPFAVLLAPVISFLLPTFQLSTSNKNGMPVSRDPEALVAKITAYLQQNLKRLRVPLLVLHGAADTVTDPDGSRKLYEEAASADKTIKLLEGFLHDLLFEPERDEIMADIIDWLNCRVVR
ncbi:PHOSPHOLIPASE-RELATED [Salix koriyanagi]|uniref:PHOSPHOLIPASE-RELATED n=1 Tax=Salix koriyanagi TaxID=2511006 RepID=A0A9Q0PGA9_9ROSI|nr:PHOSPHOLIPASE-RELATED [Salix koriyanagi]